jgi:hypothetical protein
MDPKWHLTLGRDRLIWSNSNGDFSVQYDTPIYHRFFIRPEPETKNALRLQEAFDVFTAFCNAAPDWALIVNRPLSGAMNWAKVAHMRSITRHGFQVPIALTTNKRERLQEFPVPAINKGCSGTRSIAEQADATVVQSLSDWLIVPAMLQQYIGGPDVRVHFIGYEHSALMGTSNNCHRSSGTSNLLANDSALFSFRFCAVHPKDVRDCQLRQLFEVPLCSKRNLMTIDTRLKMDLN